MNVNITGIYDNTVIVDTNLFEDVRLLQTGLSSLNDTLFNVVEGLPYTYANLTAFSNLSDNYDEFKINNSSNISTLNLDIDNINTNLSILSIDYESNKITSNSYLNIINSDILSLNTALSVLSVDVDNQFEITTTCINDKAQEQHEYTDAEIENLRNEGYIQEAVTQLLA